MAMFADRAEAGFLLAEQLTQKDVSLDAGVVCGITRGGVIVASVIAGILGIPLLPLPIKKITLPERDELAIGAIAPGEIVYWDPRSVAQFELTKADLAVLLSRAERVYKETLQSFAPYAKMARIQGKRVILVDDGIATGATVKAAALTLSRHHAKSVVLAVPVIAEVVYNEILPAFSHIVTLSIVEDFGSVGEFYSSFDQVSTEDIIALLEQK